MKLKERKTVYRNGKTYYVSPFEHYMGKIAPCILIVGIIFFIIIGLRIIFGF